MVISDATSMVSDKRWPLLHSWGLEKEPRESNRAAHNFSNSPVGPGWALLPILMSSNSHQVSSGLKKQLQNHFRQLQTYHYVCGGKSPMVGTSRVGGWWQQSAFQRGEQFGPSCPPLPGVGGSLAWHGMGVEQKGTWGFDRERAGELRVFHFALASCPIPFLCPNVVLKPKI